MKNLIHDHVSSDYIAQSLADPRPPLLPPIGAPAWKATAQRATVRELVAPLRALAESEIGSPMPVLTDELYADFMLTGMRLPFEVLYFERRRQLARAAVFALLDDEPDSGCYIDSLLDKVADIMAEPSWSLPAHVGHKVSGKDPQQIDLFCAETANLMGEIVTVFGSILPADLVARIRERVRVQVFENYIKDPSRFGWTSITNNWNGVCHQGILGAALALADADTCAAMLTLAAGYLPAFLSGFGRDGGCQEGPGYWGYGFGWFSVLNEQLETASRCELSVFEGDDQVRQIALYAGRVSLTGGLVPNFSDCVAGTRFPPRLLGYLGRRLSEPSLVALADSAFARLLADGIDSNAERCDLFYLLRLLLDMPGSVPASVEQEPGAFYFADMQVLVSRSVDDSGHRWDFAAKGGHNGEHHNHNDCGSYILNIDGAPCIIEIGSPEYTREFFSSSRYENLAARTLGHSLPTFGKDIEQAAGGQFQAKVLECSILPDRVRFVLDLTNAYPPEAECFKLHRSFDLDTRAGKLTVKDEYVLSAPKRVLTAVIAEDTLIGDGFFEITAGDVAVTVTAGRDTCVRGGGTLSYSDHRGQQASIRRLLLGTVDELIAGTLSYTVSIKN